MFKSIKTTILLTMSLFSFSFCYADIEDDVKEISDYFFKLNKAFATGEIEKVISVEVPKVGIMEKELKALDKEVEKYMREIDEYVESQLEEMEKQAFLNNIPEAERVSIIKSEVNVVNSEIEQTVKNSLARLFENLGVDPDDIDIDLDETIMAEMINPIKKFQKGYRKKLMEELGGRSTRINWKAPKKSISKLNKKGREFLAKFREKIKKKISEFVLPFGFGVRGFLGAYIKKLNKN